jgi:hypothetical protein
MAIRAAARSWRTWVFLAAFASAFWQCLIFPGAGFGAGYESAAIARSVARGHGFANPFAAGVTGPTAHLAPLFPVLLAALIRAFGDPLFSLAAATLCCTIHGIHALMLPAMARSVCGDAKAGLCAAFWVAMVPTIPVLPQWEAIYAAVAFMFFCLATGALMDSCAPEVSELRGVTDGMVAGAYSGLLMLLSPALVTAAGLWMIFRLAGRWPGRRRCVIFLAAFAAAMAAMDAPWVLRNRHELGACFFIRDNLGLELYSSNSDCAEPRASRDLPNDCHASMHPNENAREAAAVRNMGEVRYNSSRMREAVRWIERHPSRFWWLVLRRVLVSNSWKSSNLRIFGMVRYRAFGDWANRFNSKKRACRVVPRGRACGFFLAVLFRSVGDAISYAGAVALAGARRDWRQICLDACGPAPRLNALPGTTGSSPPRRRPAGCWRSRTASFPSAPLRRPGGRLPPPASWPAPSFPVRRRRQSRCS